MSTSNKFFSKFPPVSDAEWEDATKKDLQGVDYKAALKWRTNEGIEALPFILISVLVLHTIPRVLLLPMGNKKICNARSSFAANFLGCASYTISEPFSFESLNGAISKIKPIP